MYLRLVLLLVSLPCAALASEDRYGAVRASEAAQGAQTGAISAFPVQRRLTWPGQVQRPVPEIAAPVSAAVTAARPPPLSTPAWSQVPGPQSPAAPVATLRPAPSLPPVVQPVPSPSPLPVPAPIARAAPPVNSLPATGYGYGSGSARSYSVVREFGGTPDRIVAPLPQSAYRGRAEVALSPDILASQPGADAESSESEPADNGPDQDPRPVRPAPKDKR